MYESRIKVSIKRLFPANSFTASSVPLMIIRIAPDMRANVVFYFCLSHSITLRNPVPVSVSP